MKSLTSASVLSVENRTCSESGFVSKPFKEMRRDCRCGFLEFYQIVSLILLQKIPIEYLLGFKNYF